jgi:mediator of RNA polymerase II transcription subunit 13
MDTPRDASCTHILVVPTSGHAQANVTGPGNLGLGNAGVDDVLDTGGDDDAADFLTGMMGDVGDAGMDDLDTMIQGGITDISDFLGFDNNDPLTSSSDHNSLQQAGSSGGGGSFGGGGGGGNAMFSRQSGAGSMPQTDPQDEVPNLQQQPLAMGFYTSTAKTGPLPKWFWAACPHREAVSPVCLKVSNNLSYSVLCSPQLRLLI